MIKAVFFVRKKEIIGFEISGHANYAAKGSDIVCAAVSALSQAITNGLTNAVLNDDDGISVSLIPPTAANKVLCKLLYDNLKQISEQYPKNLKVKVYG
ncbi:ribosomal-processing cysteine protease Prp [Liquorilactobacillus ghanensis]|uniref:ribosomal-processing cysteine protease Prp n=1 Tax=Liquorilactobacillus ghanensis TaxID=399370 RepID=UPI0039E8645C